MSDTITKGIRVKVETEYLEAESSPESSYYLFAYHITISNHGDHPYKLMTRHWVITNAEGKKEEVKGPGVVGAQPLLKPGESFSYSSYCPLDTPIGSMYGTYQMVGEDDSGFDAVIAPFTLAVPGMLQ
jgi:ApaG protein